jgi:hypothetical protein
VRLGGIRLRRRESPRFSYERVPYFSAEAVEAKVATLLSRYADDETTDDGRERLVRHGHLPEREIMTGIGPVGVRCPRVRDRGQ